MAARSRTSNYALLFTYFLPYFAYVGALMIPERVLATSIRYGIALVGSAAALTWGWRWYVPLRGPGSDAVSVAFGLGAGLLGTALWVVIKAPFYAAGGEAWAPADFWMRLLASGTVVALFEELLFRGILLRGVVSWDRARRRGARDPLGVALHEASPRDVEPGGWTPLAVVFSSLAFAAGHQPGEWAAAVAYGLLMCGLWIVRRDLLSCVVAHGATNVSLALYVRESGQWALW